MIVVVALIIGIVISVFNVLLVFLNGYFEWGASWIALPDKVHLTILSMCFSATSLTIAIRALLTSGDSKLIGLIQDFDGSKATLIILNEADKQELISDVSLTEKGKQAGLLTPIKLEEKIFTLKKRDFMELKFSPSTNLLEDEKLIELEARVTLLNGKKLSVTVKDERR
ncbi:hypothetical protein [Vibrio splendidus]|uniref:hypothetical protein n=1 Tax=Vibrio splendidus TaxID=29497 RepID=UPI00035DA7CD|nr:hypothetical protein [Vibrio splendidus]OED84612.1 hypothetical protein A144_13570 [Vibrio splendidus ZF-90]